MARVYSPHARFPVWNQCSISSLRFMCGTEFRNHSNIYISLLFYVYTSLVWCVYQKALLHSYLPKQNHIDKCHLILFKEACSHVQFHRDIEEMCGSSAALQWSTHIHSRCPFSDRFTCWPFSVIQQSQGDFKSKDNKEKRHCIARSWDKICQHQY